MSIFDTRTINKRLVDKKTEMNINMLLEVTHEQIKAAAKIGLTSLDIRMSVLWKEVMGDMARYVDFTPYYSGFIVKLREDDDFDVDTPELDEVWELDLPIFDIGISWENADGFGTTASKMFRLSEDNADNLSIFHEIERKILHNINENGRAKAIIPFETFGIRNLFNEDKWYIQIDKMQKEISQHSIYKYISKYEDSFTINVTTKGLEVVYEG